MQQADNMDKIEHKYLDVRGLKLHVAEIGTGSFYIKLLIGFSSFLSIDN